MNTEALKAALNRMTEGCLDDPCGCRYAEARREIEAALDPGSPPVEGAIPLEGLWLLDNENTVLGERVIEIITRREHVVATFTEGAFRGWGVRVPEPPQPARQFERGDIVTVVGGQAEVLAADDGDLWVRFTDTGQKTTRAAETAVLVDTESTR